MTPLLWHARLAFREHVAERVLHSVALLWLGLVLLEPLGRDVTLGAPTRGATDVGLWLTWASGVAVATWVGIRTISAPLRRRAAAVWLVTPTPWWVYVVGRSLGGAGALACWAALALGGTLVVGLVVGAQTHGLGPWALALGAELCLVQALASLLGTLLRPLTATAGTLAVVATGHLLPSFRQWADEASLGILGRVVQALVPDLARLDLQAAVIYQEPIAAGDLALRLAFALAWTVCFVSLAAFAMRQRDLT